MKGVKGTSKTYGDLCSKCRLPLTIETGLKRGSPRVGLASKCKKCNSLYTNLEKTKSIHRAATRNHKIKIKILLFNRLGGRCACCGENRMEFLALDHIHGGGTKQRKKYYNSPHNLRMGVLKMDDASMRLEFQILCHNCNCAKGWFGKCPHEVEREKGR